MAHSVPIQGGAEMAQFVQHAERSQPRLAVSRTL